MATDLDITVNGRWLSLLCRYGDVEMSTEWPGGSDELSWTLGTGSGPRFNGGEEITACYGGVPVWAGSLVEPDPSQDRMTAQGAWHEGVNFASLLSSGGATKVPDTGIDQAILRGLRWTRPVSISSSVVDYDVTQGPATIGQILDTYADSNTKRWGVNAYREVYVASDPTSPAYQTFPLDSGLGYALDNYASSLVCRYLDSATSTYKTVTVTDSVAEGLHGDVEVVVDLTPRGAISTAQATTHGTSLLALGRATPQWTASIELAYGEILTTGGVPVALETVAAGTLLRVHGGFELAQRQNGAMYLDVPIGRTSLSDGLLTIQPLQIAARTLTDALTEALSKK